MAVDPGDAAAGRKDVEELLRNARLRLDRSSRFTEALLSAVPIPVFYKDVDGRYLGCNRAFSELMGIAPDRLKGKTVEELWPGEYADVYNSKDQELIRDRCRQVYDYKVVDRDGVERPVIYAKNVFCDENDRVAGIVGAFIDITERNRTEKELRASEERFRAIFDSVNDAIFIHDVATGAIVDVNRRMCEMYGCTREEALRADIGSLSSGEPQYTSQDAREHMEKALKGVPRLFEWRARHRSGRLFWVEVNMRQATIGGLDRLLVVVRDITERKHAEEEIARLACQNEEALRIAQMGHWELDVASRTFVFNDQFYRLHGTTAAEAGGYTMAAGEYTRKYVHPDNVDLMVRIYRMITESAGAGSEESYEGRIVRADGEPRDMLAWFRIEKDSQGRPVRLYGVNQDITERNRTGETLLESEERYRALYRDNPSMFFTLDREGKIISVNDFGASYLGYTVAELTGRPGLEIFHQEDRPAMSRQLAMCMESPGQVYHWQLRKIRKDGSLLWVEENARTVIGRDGMPVVLVVCCDITERKRAEEARENAKALAERERVRAEIYLDLMSHDISNLHQICMGYLELALASPDAGPHAAEMMSASVKTLDRSAKLIENVKKLRWLNERTPERRAIDVGGLLGRVLPGYARVPGRQVTINYSPGCDCQVMASDLLEDVLSNVVGNAIKHSSGPVTVDVRLDRVSEGGGEWCRISVEDDGPGIPDSKKARLFKRFENARALPDGGGLGLYLVKMLVDDFRGEVRVEDRVPGDHTRGSRFIIMLPIAGVREAPAGVPPDAGTER